MELTAIIPLFPLEVVLLPGMILPLHIFEERYKLMTGECLKEEKPFGIVYYDGNKIKKVGCTANILKVIKKYGDGRMDIVTKGDKRFLIQNIVDTKAYLQADLLYFDDHGEEDNLQLDETVREGLVLLEEVITNTGKDEDQGHLSELDSKELSFVISSNDAFSHEEKQRFLEMRSTHRRLKECMEALKTVLERNKLTREIGKMIGGNGDISKLLLTKIL